jgi:hypothetical protein
MSNRIKVSEHFFLDEFLDNVSYENLVKMISIAEYIRNATGRPVTINNWIMDGQYKFSGYRPPNCTEGSKTSEHRVFNAIDPKIKGMTGAEMNQWAQDHAKELYALGVRRIEDASITLSWLHTDGKDNGRKGIRIIDRTKETKFIPV